MILVALRGLWGRKTRAVLTAISIVLGTAMIAGTFVVRDQITGAFASIFQTGLEKTDVLASKRTAFTDNNGAQAGPLPALLLARAVAPSMVAARTGLIALVSFGTEEYLGDVFYDSAKAATNRLALAFGQDLAPYGVTALGLSPGFVATERARDLGQDERATEGPLYAGRALAALAADPDIAARAGAVLHAGDLARIYGFTDADGTQPERFRVGP